MTAEFIAEVQAEWQGLLAQPVRLVDLDAEPTRARVVAAVVPMQPVATPQAIQDADAALVAAQAPAAQPVAAGPADGPSFRTLTARFPGSCRRCFGRIAVGDTIRYGRVGGKAATYHLTKDCGFQAQPVAASAPAELAPVAAVTAAPAAVAQKARRTRQAAPRATIAPVAAVQAAAADDWF